MLAGVLADTFWYYLGHFGREQMIERWGRYLRIDLATINKMEQVLFGQDATQVIFTSKLTSALIIPTLVAAGLTGMGWRRVMRTIIPAQFLWSAGMIGVGFIAADSFVLISQKVENFGWIVGGVLVLVLGGRIVYRWRKIPQ
jgi:membrane protein DedA with SNARE-associated domain